MGWLIGWPSKEALVAHLMSQLNRSCSCEFAGGMGASNRCICGDMTRVLGKSIVGNTLYAAMERNGKPNGIAVILLSGVGGEWGYKDMDEGMGPCEIDCPLYLLKLAGPPVGTYAAEWREKVKAFHAAKREKRAKAKAVKAKLAKGAKIKLPEGFTPNEFEIIGVDGNNMLGLAANGRTYRLGAAALSKAEVVTP